MKTKEETRVQKVLLREYIDKNLPKFTSFIIFRYRFISISSQSSSAQK